MLKAQWPAAFIVQINFEEGCDQEKTFTVAFTVQINVKRAAIRKKYLQSHFLSKQF